HYARHPFPTRRSSDLKPRTHRRLAPMTEGEETRMPKQPKPPRGLLFANVAVLFFGLAGVLGKLSVLPAPLIVFGRAFFAGLVLLDRKSTRLNSSHVSI